MEAKLIKSTINCPDKIDEVCELLILAKNGDMSAKELLIKKYYGLIISQAKDIHLNGYTFDDLIQSGIESLLKSINSFNLDNGSIGFNTFLFNTIKNNFNYLCRKETRYNNLFSLNTLLVDNIEFMDTIPDPKILEEVIMKNITSKELMLSLKLLDKEELELIKFLYLNDTKQMLSKYSTLKGQDYYYCTCLKKRALSKLK